MRIEKIVLAFAQMQDHVGAAAFLAHGLDGVVAPAARFPAHAVLGREPRAARDQCHAVGDDERRIETHAELADEVGVLRPVPGQAFEELSRAGFGYGADVVDHLLARHAHAIVRNGEGARRLVHIHPDLQLRVGFEQRGIGQRLEAQLVAGIRGIRDQLAQRDLLVAVQRMDHQLQELLHLGLESEGFPGCGGFAHRGSSYWFLGLPVADDP